MNFYKSIFYIYVFWIKKIFIIEDITIVSKYSDVINDKKKFLNQLLGKMNLSLFDNIRVFICKSFKLSGCASRLDIKATFPLSIPFVKCSID